MTLDNQGTTNSDELCSCNRSQTGTDRAGDFVSFLCSFVQAFFVLLTLFSVMYITALIMGLPTEKVVGFQKALAQEAFGKHTVLFTTFTLIIVSAINLFFPTSKYIENFRFTFQCLLVGMSMAAAISLMFGLDNIKSEDLVFTFAISFIAYALGFFTNCVIAFRLSNKVIGTVYLLGLIATLICQR